MKLRTRLARRLLVGGFVTCTVCLGGEPFVYDMGTGEAILRDLAARRVTAAEEATDRKLTARAVELLGNGEWVEGVAAAEEAWETWRRVYGGRPLPLPTASGIFFPPVDPEVIYVRKPSVAALEGAEQILEMIRKGVEPDLAEALLRVRVPGLDSHAYSEAGRIGLELCRTGPKVEGILLLAQARQSCILMYQRQQRDLHQGWWVAPRLTQRQAQYFFAEGNIYDQIYMTLKQIDAQVLAEAYRILSARDTVFRTLRDLLNASLRMPERQSGLSMAVVAEAIKDPRVEMRLLAVNILNRRHNHDWDDPDRATQLLRSRLEDYDGEVRYAAGTALLSWGHDAGLAAVVGRSAEKLGLLNLESIGHVGAISATPWLVKVGRTGEAWQRRDVVRSLWKLGDPAAVEFLGEVLLDEQEEPLTRQLAVAALGATMDDRAFPLMSKALETADEKLADRIIAYMTEIRPELSFPVLVQSMEQMGILDGQPTAGRNLGIAWLRLHHCSGYRDVVGQYLRDPEALKAGMQEYWEGRRELHEATRRVRYFRFLHPDPEREAEARQHLAEVRQRVSQGSRDSKRPSER